MLCRPRKKTVKNIDKDLESKDLNKIITLNV